MTRISRAHLIAVFDQLEMYASSGISMPDALRLSARSMPRKIRTALDLAAEGAEGGRSPSAALSSLIRLPGSLVAILRSGEASGSVPRSLASCRQLLEQKDDLVKKTVSAMIYPVVIGFATLGLALGLMRGIMPQIAPLLRGLKGDLPLLTKIVMAASDGLLAYGWAILASLIIGAVASRMTYVRVRTARRMCQLMLRKIPIIGSFYESYHLSIFFSSIAAMTAAGISAHGAYESALASVESIPLRERMESQLALIKAGGGFERIARGMPPYVSGLIAAGESSGNLPLSMARIGAMLSKDLGTSLRRLVSLVEPAMMIGMGGLVGSIALSIMLPIYDISRTLQR